MKKPILLLVLFTANLSILSGCVTTDLTAYTDPAYVDSQFENMAVYVETDDIGDRSKLEQLFRHQAAKKGVSVAPSIEFMPPTRATSHIEMLEGMRMHGFDSILVVNMTGSASRNVLVSDYNGGFSQGTVLSAEFNATLVDAESLAVVWTSSSDSQTTVYNNWTELLSSYSQSAIDSLVESGLIVAP